MIVREAREGGRKRLEMGQGRERMQWGVSVSDNERGGGKESGRVGLAAATAARWGGCRDGGKKEGTGQKE